jgi:hypothetical protein
MNVQIKIPENSSDFQKLKCSGTQTYTGGTDAKLRNATISFIKSVRPPWNWVPNGRTLKKFDIGVLFENM